MDIIITGDFSNWSDEAKRKFRVALLQGTLHLESVVVEEAPAVTGNLRNTISSNVEGMRGVVTIGSKYSIYIVEGTGIYGPRGKRIVPKTKKALAFTYKGIPMVRRSVRGMKPNPFHERAADQALGKILEILGRVSI